VGVRGAAVTHLVVLQGERGANQLAFEQLQRVRAALPDARITLVRARDLAKVGAGGGVGEENITVHRVPLADIRSFIDAKRADGCGIDVRMLLLLGQNILAGE